MITERVEEILIRDQQEASHVFERDSSYLKVIGDHYGIDVSGRGNLIRMKGEDEVVTKAAAVVERPQDHVSPAAVAHIVRWEITSPAYYDKRLRWPIWPGGASGVTWCIGYDGGHQTGPVIPSSPKTTAKHARSYCAK